MARKDRRRRYLRKQRKAKERKRESSKHHKVSFVDLPGELRNQIYDYIIEDAIQNLPPSEVDKLSPGWCPYSFNSPDPVTLDQWLLHRMSRDLDGLLYSNAQIHDELSARLLSSCRFRAINLEALLRGIGDTTGYKFVRYLTVDVYEVVYRLAPEAWYRGEGWPVDLDSWDMASLPEYEIAAHKASRLIIKVCSVLKLETLHLDMSRLPEDHDFHNIHLSQPSDRPKVSAGNIVVGEIAGLIDAIPTVEITSRKFEGMTDPPKRWNGVPSMNLADALAASGDNELFYHF